jgi:pSer/pThr/pTyr-binding forkhead associated (FHA) protein
MANYVLEILDGDRAGDVLSLSSQPLRIGRKPGNDLVLADEKTSGVHAEVVLEGDRHVLRDLGSTNGTFLDGKRVTELVLTPGDVVTVGRLRVKFRVEGEESGGAEAGDLAMHHLDAGRLRKRGGSVGLLAALVVLGLGAGGYLWWQGRSDGGAATGGGRKREPALVLAGNKLAPGLASCESEDGWNLRYQGAGFQASTRAHTGAGAFEAVRGDAGDAPDFAIAALQEPIAVLGGRTLTLKVWARTEGTAQAAVRAVFYAANDANPFHYRAGTAFQAQESWSEQSVVLTVPQGCDRMQVELCAVLGASGAVVSIDDVAVLEAGEAAGIDLELTESRQKALGTGSAIAVRSTDPDNPATLLAVLPDRATALLEGLRKAGFGCISDLGATLKCTATERSFQLAAEGMDALQFVFPAEAAGSLLVRSSAEAGFASMAAESQFQASSLLLGDRDTRAMLQFATPVACQGTLGNGLYRLSVQAPAAELVLGFRTEANQAGELLRTARRELQNGKPGAALDVLRDLANKFPHDSATLSQAQQLRSQLLATQGEVLKQLQKDLAEASFFDTRGGFERVVLGTDRLLALYGEQNLEDLAAAQALRNDAQQRLTAMDEAQHEAERGRLEALAKALDSAQQTGLAGVVQDYVKRHLGGK